MNPFENTLPAYAAVALGILVYCVSALCVGAVIAALAAAIVRCWRPLDASARYVVWFVALVAVVLGPLVLSFVIARTPHVPTPEELAAALQTRSVAAGAPLNVLQRPAIAISPQLAYGPAVLWLLVVLGGLVRFVAGIAVLGQLKRDALPLSPERRAALPLWNACAAAPSARRARLCASERVDVPVALGLLSAMVLLPRHVLDEFEPPDVDRFALHELAHLERRDDWTALVQRLAQILQFFNPALHFIARRLDLEREIACDDRVVAVSCDVRSYAIGLTRMAESTPWPHHALAAPAIFATRKQLSLRVEELLSRRRLAAPRIAMAPAVVALAGSLGLVAAAAVHAPSVGVDERLQGKVNTFTLSEVKNVTIVRRFAGTPPALPDDVATALRHDPNGEAFFKRLHALGAKRGADVYYTIESRQIR